MKPFIKTALFFLIVSIANAQTSIKDAWDAFRSNEVQKAKSLFEKNLTESPFESNLGLAFLSTLDLDREKGFDHFTKAMDHADDAEQWLLSYWSNNMIFGKTSKLSTKEKAWLDGVLASPKYSYKVKNLARFQIARHHYYSLQLPKAKSQMGDISHDIPWMLLGAFKDYQDAGEDYLEILNNPDTSFSFSNLPKPSSKWRKIPTKDVSIFINPETYYAKSGVSYAQSFFKLDTDKEMLFQVYLFQSAKFWVDNELVINHDTASENGIDPYVVKIKLSKGNHRIVAQFIDGYSYGYGVNPHLGVLLTDTEGNLLKEIIFLDHPVKTVDTKPNFEVIHSWRKTVKYFSDKFAADTTQMPARIGLLISGNTNDAFVKGIKANDYLKDCFGYKLNSINQSDYSVAYNKADSWEIMRAGAYQYSREYNGKEKVEKEKRRQIFTTVSGVEDSMMVAFRMKDALTIKQLLKLLEKYNNPKVKDLAFQWEIAARSIEEGEMALKEEMTKYLKNSNNLEKYLNYLYLQSQMNKIEPKDLKKLEEFLKTTYHSDAIRFLSIARYTLGKDFKSYDSEKWYKMEMAYNPTWRPYVPNGMNDPKQKEERLKASLAITPDEGGTWLELAKLYDVTKDKVKATEAYEMADEYEALGETSKKEKLGKKTELLGIMPDIDIEEVIKREIPSKWKNDPVIVLHDETRVFMDDEEEDLNESKNFYVLKVQTQEGVDMYNEEISYYGEEKIYIVKPDGKKIIIPSGGIPKLLGLQPGDGLYSQNSSARGSSYGQSLFATKAKLVTMTHSTTYSQVNGLKMVLKLMSKRSLDLDIMQPLHIANPTITYPDSTHIIRHWEINNLEKVTEDEPFEGPSSMPEYLIRINKRVKWSEMSDFFYHRYEERVASDAALKTLLSNIMSGKNPKDDFGKAELIYEYIANNFQYISNAKWQHDYIPQLPAKTCSKKLGDCKDLTTLFIALCREAKLNVNFCLVGTQFDISRRSLPTFDAFNHVIAKLYANGKVYHIELTEPNIIFTSNNLEGNIGLELLPSDSNAAAYAIPPHEVKNVYTQEYEMDVNESAIKGKFKSVFTGMLMTDKVRSFQNTTYDDIKKDYDDRFRGTTHLNIVLDTIVLDTFEAREKKQCSVSNSYTIYDPWDEISGFKLLDLPGYEYFSQSNLSKLAKRKHPLDLRLFENSNENILRYNIRFSAPLRLYRLPPDKVYSTPHFDFFIKYSKPSNQEIRVERRVVFKKRFVELSEYEEFKKMVGLMSKAEKIAFLFE